MPKTWAVDAWLIYVAGVIIAHAQSATRQSVDKRRFLLAVIKERRWVEATADSPCGYALSLLRPT